jgi:hypothetical protein
MRGAVGKNVPRFGRETEKFTRVLLIHHPPLVVDFFSESVQGSRGQAEGVFQTRHLQGGNPEAVSLPDPPREEVATVLCIDHMFFEYPPVSPIPEKLGVARGGWKKCPNFRI